MASIITLWSRGWASMRHVHFEEFVGPYEPNSRSKLCGKLLCVSCSGHVRGEEQYDYVSW